MIRSVAAKIGTAFSLNFHNPFSPLKVSKMLANAHFQPKNMGRGKKHHKEKPLCIKGFKSFMYGDPYWI